MVIQGVLLLAVHEQPPAAVTAIVRASPDAATVLRSGVTVYAHVGTGVGDGVGAGAGAGAGGTGSGAGGVGGTGSGNGPGVGGAGKGCAAAWLICTSWPATLTLPLRAGPAFARTSNSTEPLPWRLPAPTTVIQSASLRAVHEQPSRVVTLTAICSPPGSRSRLDGDT